MISINTHKNRLNPFWDIRGKSTDSKPVNGVPNGSTYCEIDTGKGYMFDEATDTWYEIPSGSSVVINPARGEVF